jgi:hypothetical protein
MASSFAGGMGDPSVTVFSPAECLVGGMFIGVSVVARAFALGTVTGISGIFGATVRFESLEKAAFSIGLFLSGVALFWGAPAPFLRGPDSLPVFRPVVAAVLVALGTHFGNGCTRSVNYAVPQSKMHVFVKCALLWLGGISAIAHVGAVATASAASRASQPAPSWPFQHSCAAVPMHNVLACCHL